MTIRVLDHGYVQLVETWGHGLYAEAWEGPNHEVTYHQDDHEVGIIEAARQSTQGSFRGWETDEKLLKFLYNNDPATPFEFAGMVIEVQAPIFVFREWHRHRTQSYNEMSARYTPLPDLYYIPTEDRLKAPSGSNKQSSGAKLLSEQDAVSAVCDITRVYNTCEQAYQSMLASGVPKELAQLVMPVGHYSRMRASANLRNWLAFLTLRCAPNVQWETRQFALAVDQIVSETFPRTHRLFVDRREREV